MNEPKVSIGLSNPKSPENVNSVKRAAGNFRVDSIYYTGKEITDRADAVVYVPTKGCMNLAATVNVVLYDRH